MIEVLDVSAVEEFVMTEVVIVVVAPVVTVLLTSVIDDRTQERDAVVAANEMVRPSVPVLPTLFESPP